MKERTAIKRTNSSDPDFALLLSKPDHELWNELNEDQATCDQYNKVPGLSTVLVLYLDERPAACGCFKEYDQTAVEVRRMFVEKEFRGKGLSKIVLAELERWAVELGYCHALLETSVRFTAAKNLYAGAGYFIIDNYDPYRGSDKSVCMKKRLQAPPAKHKENYKTTDDQLVSLLRQVKDIEYFGFEEDFVEKDIRCIPMIVRFKMDKAGIKLKLEEWSKFSLMERVELASRECGNEDEVKLYAGFLSGLIYRHTGNSATELAADPKPGWDDPHSLPPAVLRKAAELDVSIQPLQWRALSELQRFALVKLSRSGHESKNLRKALREFGLRTTALI